MTDTSVEISPPQSEADVQACAALIAGAFFMPAERAGAYVESLGRGNLRAAYRQGRPAAALAMIAMGQFWGAAEAIPMAGISAVAVASEHRSQGVGRQLMAGVLRECRANGFALAALYPATQPVYRSVGFEAAGCHCTIELPLNTLNFRERSIEVRRATAEDQGAIRGLYRAWAAQNRGNVDRNEFIWERVANFRGVQRTGYVLMRDGAMEGYFYAGEAIPSNRPRVTEVGDLVFTTPAAARRFLQFLADHRSMVDKAMWAGPPNDAVLLLAREQSAKVGLDTLWMLRILDPGRALAMRGYPAGLSAKIHLEVRDELFPENSGGYMLAVEGGRGEVRRQEVGDPDVTLSMAISTLAPLFSSLYSAQQLASLGLLAGSAAAQALATSIFSAPVPWMRDFF